MFRIRSKLPVTDEQREWIERSFQLLTELFGDEWHRTAPIVLPTEQFFPRKWEETEEWARHAFDCVCTLMHVQRERLQLEFVEDPWADLRQSDVPLGFTYGAAGMYHE